MTSRGVRSPHLRHRLDDPTIARIVARSSRSRRHPKHRDERRLRGVADRATGRLIGARPPLRR